MPRSSTSSSGSQRQVKQRDVPKTGAFDALLYFSGRDPRKVKAVRAVYYGDVDDSASIASGNSMWSMWSSSSQSNVQYYFVEPRGYWAEPQDYIPSRKSKSRASGRSRAAPPNPAAAWARNATVQDDDDDDDDDSDDGSDASPGPYGPQGGPRPPGPGFMRPPGAGMPMPMPPHGPPRGPPQMGGPPRMGGPPQMGGPLQMGGPPPGFGMGPRPSTMGPPGHGFPPPPPGPPGFARGPPPPGTMPPFGVHQG
ncbi:hypothetical protein QBC35DRAFT_471379 [Podospora australis]|uniref:Uncharacterized protein n=1 Tax=Podospora australis TaxID=1536484 RepID=A0AAN6WYI6_9PEZI|nr:hypothetical protein QBC35DRAFT_471379 [Podospora australis]